MSSRVSQHVTGHMGLGVRVLTKWVTARELRLLGISGSQFVTNAVEKLYIALLGFFLEGGDKGPGHGTGSLRRDRSIRPRACQSCLYAKKVVQGDEKPEKPKRPKSRSANATRRPRYKIAPSKAATLYLRRKKKF